MQRSLKPWLLRFQKALSAYNSASENHWNQACDTIHGIEDTKDVQSPEESKIDSLISPSPLVVCQRECNVVESECKRNKANACIKSATISENKSESTMEPEFHSPPKFSQKNCSVLVFTPHMKISTLKSCVLLEPITELTGKSYHGVRKSSPFPVGLQGSSCLESSESSNRGTSEKLSLEYPELFGIQSV